METIISSVISGLVALAVCLLNSNSQRRTADAKHNETIAIINVKIDNLASKVEKHNGVIERTYKRPSGRKDQGRKPPDRRSGEREELR